MKLSKIRSIEIIAIVGIGFSVGVSASLAQDSRCYGLDCNDKAATEYGCVVDALVREQITITVNRWQDAGQAQPITIQKMYSEICNATWTRAYVPNESFLYITENDLANSNQLTRGLLKATGTGYFWADGNMVESRGITQACVALPILSTGSGHEIYDRHCTPFNN
ncbi:hypothetical protein [Myxacorys almedinensis]|uniref:DUF2690 domain-containing protein n=1 Tax=Myxacorys almedinensis A TaxID=2690445 RepID=A0A8J7Z301_9CYAN|nr:hypothetical protein [Myxacorys almedinensis]NDJ19422.1 hypothetical protein [Myxacorys almedinensis A]